MAKTKRICSVDGCGKPHASNGFCPAYAYKFRKYGDPLAGKTKAGNGAALRWMDENKTYCGNDCLEWPFALGKGGYGNVWDGRNYTNAHRLMCAMAYGEPEGEMQAAHSCGNRSCVNPQHLRWATQIENDNDKDAHGTRRMGEAVPTSKLTEADVRRIRSSTSRVNELAREFGVGHQQISRIRRGERWGWLK